MLALNDERNELWQWDTGRKLTVDADCSQVHFSNKVFGRSIDVDVVDGVAIIPDILLQTDKDLNAWEFVGTAESGYTKISKVFKVNKRNKPADYVFTPTDQTTLGEILDRIEDLENRPSGDVSKEDIQDAVNDYLDKNPVSVEEKDPTVPNWAKQPNPPKQPNALPNPHKLTFTGAVTAEYDGSEAVEVKIPEGGGIEVTGAEVGQTIVVKAVDETGKPTEWECAELPSGGSEWELFDTITLEEAVSDFGFGLPILDGENEFRDKGYKKLLLQIWLPKVEANVKTNFIIGFNTWGGGKTYTFPNTFVLEKEWENVIHVYAEMLTDKYYLINVTRVPGLGSVVVGNKGNDYITDKFSCFRLINNYPAGSTIKIWGSKK